MIDWPKFPKNLTTFQGFGPGKAAVRGMEMEAGGMEGIRRVERRDPDGTVHVLNTRNGFPEVVTTRPAATVVQDTGSRTFVFSVRGSTAGVVANRLGAGMKIAVSSFFRWAASYAVGPTKTDTKVKWKDVFRLEGQHHAVLCNGLASSAPTATYVASVLPFCLGPGEPATLAWSTIATRFLATLDLAGNVAATASVSAVPSDRTTGLSISPSGRIRALTGRVYFASDAQGMYVSAMAARWAYFQATTSGPAGDGAVVWREGESSTAYLPPMRATVSDMTNPTAPTEGPAPAMIIAGFEGYKTESEIYSVDPETGVITYRVRSAVDISRPIMYTPVDQPAPPTYPVLLDKLYEDTIYAGADLELKLRMHWVDTVTRERWRLRHATATYGGHEYGLLMRGVTAATGHWPEPLRNDTAQLDISFSCTPEAFGDALPALISMTVSRANQETDANYGDVVGQTPTSGAWGAYSFVTGAAALAAYESYYATLTSSAGGPIYAQRVEDHLSTSAMTLSCTTRDHVFADIDEGIYLYLESVLTAVVSGTFNGTLSSHGSSTALCLARTVTTLTLSRRYVLDVRGNKTNFDLATLTGFAPPPITRGMGTGDTEITYLNRAQPFCAWNPPFSSQGNCGHIAYTTKAEEALGATPEIYVDFNVACVNEAGYLDSAAYEAAGVTLLYPEKLYWTYATLLARGEDYENINSSLYTTLFPSSPTAQTRVQFANGVKGPWSNQLGDGFSGDPMMDISRI